MKRQEKDDDRTKTIILNHCHWQKEIGTRNWAKHKMQTK